MRLIDADALIKFIENRYDITWEDDYEGGIKDACTDILEEINKMPTIEPEQENYTELKREFLRTALYIDALLECSDEQKKILIGFISRLIELMPWTERD